MKKTKIKKDRRNDTQKFVTPMKNFFLLGLRFPLENAAIMYAVMYTLCMRYARLF